MLGNILGFFDVKRAEPQDEKPKTFEDFSESEQILLVDVLLTKYIRELLRLHNGNAEVVRVEGFQISIKLTGACAICNGKEGTRFAIEKLLQKRIDRAVEVVVVE